MFPILIFQYHFSTFLTSFIYFSALSKVSFLVSADRCFVSYFAFYSFLDDLRVEVHQARGLGNVTDAIALGSGAAAILLVDDGLAEPLRLFWPWKPILRLLLFLSVIPTLLTLCHMCLNRFNIKLFKTHVTNHSFHNF
jgi:hypothetical protein